MAVVHTVVHGRDYRGLRAAVEEASLPRSHRPQTGSQPVWLLHMFDLALSGF